MNTSQGLGRGARCLHEVGGGTRGLASSLEPRALPTLEGSSEVTLAVGVAPVCSLGRTAPWTTHCAFHGCPGKKRFSLWLSAFYYGRCQAPSRGEQRGWEEPVVPQVPVCFPGNVESLPTQEGI